MLRYCWCDAVMLCYLKLKFTLVFKCLRFFFTNDDIFRIDRLTNWKDCADVDAASYDVVVFFTTKMKQLEHTEHLTINVTGSKLNAKVKEEKVIENPDFWESVGRRCGECV